MQYMGARTELLFFPSCADSVFQEGEQAERYRDLHVQKNPDSKTFIVGEKCTTFVVKLLSLNSCCWCCAVLLLLFLCSLAAVGRIVLLCCRACCMTRISYHTSTGSNIAIITVRVRSARICNVRDEVTHWNVADSQATAE